MKSKTVSLLCSPGTHEPLRLDIVPGSEGSAQEVLVGVHSAERFPIREGIPLLLDDWRITCPL